MARADLVCHQSFLSRALSQRLEALARGPGASKSRILAQALGAFLERNNAVGLESLALFIRYMLTVNAPLPEDDRIAQAIGRDRFNAFVERVGRHLAGGRLSLLPGDGE